MQQKNDNEDHRKHSGRVRFRSHEECSLCRKHTKIRQSDFVLMYRPRWTHARIEFDFPKRSLVARHILLKQSQQRLRLLRAQIDTLEIPDLDVRLALLLQR